MFLDGGRKPEYPERTHAYTGRTCKLHTERPQPGVEPPCCEAMVLTMSAAHCQTCHVNFTPMPYQITKETTNFPVCRDNFEFSNRFANDSLPLVLDLFHYSTDYYERKYHKSNEISQFSHGVLWSYKWYWPKKTIKARNNGKYSYLSWANNYETMT